MADNGSIIWGREDSVPEQGKINPIQKLQLELMKERFNEYDGFRVVADLESNRELWRAVILTRVNDISICLRDLDEGIWNADTVLILSSGKDDAALEQVAHQWRADEISWTGLESLSSFGSMAEPNGTGSNDEADRVLVIWWD